MNASLTEKEIEAHLAVMEYAILQVRMHALDPAWGKRIFSLMDAIHNTPNHILGRFGMINETYVATYYGPHDETYNDKLVAIYTAVLKEKKHG